MHAVCDLVPFVVFLILSSLRTVDTFPTNSSSTNPDPAPSFENIVRSGIAYLEATEPSLDMYKVEASPPSQQQGTSAREYRGLWIWAHYTDSPAGHSTPGHPGPEGLVGTHNGYDLPTSWAGCDFEKWPPSRREGGGVFADWLWGEQGATTLNSALVTLRREGYPGPWLKMIMVKFLPGHDPEGSTSSGADFKRQVYYAFLRKSSPGKYEWVLWGSLSKGIHIFQRGELPLDNNVFDSDSDFNSSVANVAGTDVATSK